MAARTAITLADPKILGPAVIDSFRKLDPRAMARNPEFDAFTSYIAAFGEERAAALRGGAYDYARAQDSRLGNRRGHARVFE